LEKIPKVNSAQAVFLAPFDNIVFSKKHRVNNSQHSDSRRVRVFVSSTFRDMIEERNVLMTHTWPELRRFCRERYVELVEVDLRWGIAEEQSTQKGTLKLCLDEIRACRPYFISLLGERYGWIPGDDAFTADLKEEQPWLKDLHGKSVTELEIFHGVLNNPEMAGRSFFYFRDPDYIATIPAEKRSDFLSENAASAEKQRALKQLIRATCGAKSISLVEKYPDPHSLASMVLEQLEEAIDGQFPKESIPDPLTREARDHEAFAEIRRRTYIGRPEYFEALDRHCMAHGSPFVVLGDSGSGKSALIANWVERWRKAYQKDVIFQHYIGGTSDSAVHWKLMARLIAEIKKWCGDDTGLPTTNDEILRDFSLWLAKARIKAEHYGVRFVVILDALNQLEERDHAQALGWLPSEPFRGNLRLIVSSLPGEALVALERRQWQTMRIQALTSNECGRMIADYLGRFGKVLDKPRLERLSKATASANPLYLKVLLDELRVTGTHEFLDERLNDYLSAASIPDLLKKVLTRYQRDYECDRKNLVSDTLGLIWGARRGLAESELLRILRPANLPQLPLATWSPLRAVLEEVLIDRGGILNFAHDFLRTAVGTAFAHDLDTQDDFRLQLADYFEAQPVTSRTCDELPWLLSKTEAFVRLRKCLLNIDCFLEIMKRDEEELRGYWVALGEERGMGRSYLDSFNQWLNAPGTGGARVAFACIVLGEFLRAAALYAEAEPLMRRALQIDEANHGRAHPSVAVGLNNLAGLLLSTNRLSEAESLLRRALEIDEASYGPDHPLVAIRLNNLAGLLQATNRPSEAEPLMWRALKIFESSSGREHPNVAVQLDNLGGLLQVTGRLSEAEPLMRRALEIFESSFGKNHPNVATQLNNLARLLQATNRLSEAELLMRRALEISKSSFGDEHPNVATLLNNIAQLMKATNRFSEAEPLMRRALGIDETTYGPAHPDVGRDLNNLASLLCTTNRFSEAEPLMWRALAIDEASYGPGHPNVAIRLNNLAQLLLATNRISQAEPLMRRHLEILLNFTRAAGHPHPHLMDAVNNYACLLQSMGYTRNQIIATVRKIAPELVEPE
jgi:nephrocystin-3